ncbi:MAG: ABC transporter ATP-binding protein [Bacteroidota bacterium]
MLQNRVINVQNLTKKFGVFTAVDSISFHVEQGEIFGFLGANGAGKTTAIKMLNGLSKPTSGSGTVAGFDINTQSEQIKKRIGYMSQKFSLYGDLTVKENIRFYAGIYGLSHRLIRQRTQSILQELHLQTVKNQLVDALPLGWKQRLSFAISMIHEPDIVFLDEPTGGVDPKVRRQFWETIYEVSEQGRTIFVTTHYMDEAEYCDRVSIMVAGKIEALNTPEALKEEFSAISMDDVFLKLARE